MSAANVREHYAKVCHCEWSDDEFTRTMTSERCSIHGTVPDPLDALIAERDRYRAALRKIGRLHPWVPSSPSAAMQEARRALNV